MAGLDPHAGSRRILITGLSSHWGGRLAQVLESLPELEAVIGVDTRDPRHELQRTEFVRVDLEQGRLRRIITAAGIDTVVVTGRAGTEAVLAACADARSPVRKLVFKASSAVLRLRRG